LAPPYLQMIFGIYLNRLRGIGLPIGAVVTVLQAVSGHRVVTVGGRRYLTTPPFIRAFGRELRVNSQPQVAQA